MKNRKYTSLVLVLTTGILLTLTACGGGTDKKEKLAELKQQRDKIEGEIRALEAEIKKEGGKLPDETPGVAVAVTPVATGSFIHYIELQGRVDADENVTINAEMPGTVTSVRVSAGQNVSRGQVLAEIDNAVTLKGIEEVEGQLALARTVFEKQERLWNQKIGTEIQYLSAKNNKEALEKRLATLNQQLDMSRIKSPINGTVDEVFLKPGQMAAPGMPGIRIVNLAKLKVKADVAEAYVSRVKSGNEVIVHFPDLDQDMNSVIDHASKVINPLNRSFTVEVRMTGPTADLRPNMIAVLRIADYKNENVIVVPTAVLRKEDQTHYVMVAVTETGKKVARRRDVVTGENSAGKIEIKNGLKPGDQLITAGHQELNDGDLIKF